MAYSRNPSFRYAGVTGFMHADEIEHAGRSFDAPRGCYLMAGVLMSSKTLKGEANKWPGRFPKREDVANIFRNYDPVYNTVHYNTDDGSTLDLQLEQVMEYAGPNLHGFQINHPWPNPVLLERFRQKYPQLSLILQVGHRALAEVDNSGANLARTLDHHYSGIVQYVLLDPSGGLGKELDPEKMEEYLARIYDRGIPPFGVGIAGGLCRANAFKILSPFFKKYARLSVDAEGKLRSPQPEDKLVEKHVSDYLGAVAHLFGQAGIR